MLEFVWLSHNLLDKESLWVNSHLRVRVHKASVLQNALLVMKRLVLGLVCDSNGAGLLVLPIENALLVCRRK